MNRRPARMSSVVRSALFVAMAAIPALAGDRIRLESPTLPAPFVLRDGKADLAIEASAVEPIGDGRLFLVAHDKHPALHVIEAATGRHVGPPLTSPRFPALSKAGPKWEGMARDSAGYYYLIGAHNGKTEEERLSKSVLIRFRLRGESGPSPAIDDASVVRWEVAPALAAGLKRLGLDPKAVDARKVEGLTVRERARPGGEIGRELVIGLREPGDRVRAFRADLDHPPADGGELTLAPAFSFQADDREGVPLATDLARRLPRARRPARPDRLRGRGQHLPRQRPLVHPRRIGRRRREGRHLRGRHEGRGTGRARGRVGQGRGDAGPAPDRL